MFVLFLFCFRVTRLNHVQLGNLVEEQDDAVGVVAENSKKVFDDTEAG